jgi:hypothetical protein
MGLIVAPLYSNVYVKRVKLTGKPLESFILNLCSDI